MSQISMKDGFEKNCKHWGRHFGVAGVGAQPQFSRRAYRRSQNAPASTPTGYKIGGSDGDALGVRMSV
jgi:hypothetical protein